MTPIETFNLENQMKKFVVTTQLPGDKSGVTLLAALIPADNAEAACRGLYDSLAKSKTGKFQATEVDPDMTPWEFREQVQEVCDGDEQAEIVEVDY